MEGIIAVRPMNEADIPTALRLEEACFADPWSAASFRSAFSGGLTYFFADEMGQKFIGYAGVQLILDEGFVTNIAVDPAARRLGAGRALLNALLCLGREKRLATLSLEARPSNTPALRLYESAGFKEAGRRRGFYTHPAEDCLILTYYYN